MNDLVALGHCYKFLIDYYYILVLLLHQCIIIVMSHFLPLILLLFSVDKSDNDYYYYDDNDDGNMTNRFCTSKLQKVVSSRTEDEKPHLANYLSKDKELSSTQKNDYMCDNYSKPFSL